MRILKTRQERNRRDHRGSYDTICDLLFKTGDVRGIVLDGGLQLFDNVAGVCDGAFRLRRDDDAELHF